jgi:hypothetical protein
MDGPPDGDAEATVEVVGTRKRATIRLCFDFEELTPEIQRHNILHELVHIHMSGATELVRCDLCKSLGQAAYDIFEMGFRRQMELGIDEVTRVIEFGFPMPGRSKPKPPVD